MQQEGSPAHPPSRIARGAGIATLLVGLVVVLFGDVKTPANFRLLSDLVQNVLVFNLVLLVFLPARREIKIALVLGAFNVVVDFVLETVAVALDWWYPLGGTQFPPVVVVPLEMVASFFLIGAAFALVMTFPAQIRASENRVIHRLEPLVRHPRRDWAWRVALIVVNAVVGTHGDYTAGPEIWQPGPAWHPAGTFLVWLLGGLASLALFTWLERRAGHTPAPNPA